MVSTNDVHLINGLNVKSAPETCSNYNIIYCFICNFTNCNKCYVGRTFGPLRDRTTDHRNKFYKLLDNPNLKLCDTYRDDDNDTFSLGEHLITDHQCDKRSDLKKYYTVFILMNSSPTSLEVNEHKFIHKLKTIKPFGINSNDPFGIPLLDIN